MVTKSEDVVIYCEGFSSLEWRLCSPEWAYKIYEPMGLLPTLGLLLVAYTLLIVWIVNSR